MAIDSAPGHTRHISSGVRRLDHLQANVRSIAESDLDSRSVRAYGTVSKIGHNHYIVRAWIIVFIISIGVGAACAALIERGHW